MTTEPTAHRETLPDLRLEMSDGLGRLTFDRPSSKVNLLTRAVMQRLDELLAELEGAAGRGELRALVLRSSKPDNFIAGADIDELAELGDDAAAASQLSRQGQQLFTRLERLTAPTVAAIHGTCVGGGLELALACRYRVASDHPKTRLGLPETRLGILPGLGGTVRLPRLIGLNHGLDLILSGRQISAARARSMGLVDRVVPAASFDDGIEALTSALLRGERPFGPRRRTLARRLQDANPGRWLIGVMARRTVLARTKGHYPAPLRALDVTVRGLGMPADRAHAEEAQAFGELAVTPECKNLIAVFRLTEGARKRAPAGAPRTVGGAAVVGAGLMGSGIAELFAYQKIPVRVVELDQERLQAGLERTRSLLEKAAKRRRWSSEQLKTRADCIVGSTDFEGFEAVDLVIEAVVEKMEIKRDVFARLEESVSETAVIATNTSALSVSELQKSMRHPERACGLHFFNPPHLMPLVEVVGGIKTSDDTLATAFDLAIRLGKTPVVVADSPGFVVNRILAAYLTEAGHLLHEGMSVETVDQLMSRFGMPMGPLRLLDEIGLDVVAEVSRTMEKGLGSRFAPAPVMNEILALGLLGRKGGRGFYRYRDGRSRGLDPEVADVLRAAASGGPPTPAAAQERMVFGMVNEAARALDDRVVAEPADVDIAMIMGTGFPPFRGGLLRYADSVGLEKITQRLRIYAEQLDGRFEPAPGLLRRSAFYS